MGFSADRISPYLMDWTLSRSRFRELRREGLAAACGSLLETGFGTGLNLPHYPGAVTKLTVLDPATLFPATVTRRIASASIPVEVLHRSAEHLPFRNKPLRLRRRRLCPLHNPRSDSGTQGSAAGLETRCPYLFLEHGRSDDAWGAG